MTARLLLQLALLFWANASARGAVFEDANRYYEQGNYAEAIPLYENLLKAGHRAPGVFFNLGNAHFKNGELGRAILQYRRAQRIAPRDPDVQANLRFARDRVSGSVSVRPGLSERMLQLFTVNEIAVTAAALLWIWIGLLCFICWRPSARSVLRPYIIISASLLAVGLLLLAAAYRSSKQPTAIVLGQQATIRLGPLQESQPAFTATDGVELRVLARREDWLQVADRSGRTGWIAAGSVVVFPEQ
jgi:tetratricopeptide (TPR) repeat protein